MPNEDADGERAGPDAEWGAHDFTAEQVAQWRGVGCFLPAAAAALRDGGVKPSDCRGYRVA
jgi:hypothetical protein